MLVLIGSFSLYNYVHLMEDYDDELFYRMELEYEIDKITRENDSLRNECLIKDIDLGRYESVVYQLDPMEQAHFSYLLGRSE